MIKHIEDRVLRLSALVSSWKRHGNIPRIERDLALDELREIYDALLNVDDGRVAPEPLPAPQSVLEQPVAHPEPKPAPTPAPQPVVERIAEPEPQIDHTADPVADFDDALDIDAILGIGDEKPQGEPEPKNETNNGGGLFAIEDIPVRKKSSRKMISLYNSAPAAPVRKAESPATQQPATAPQYSASTPQPTPQPVAQSVTSVADIPAPQRLGDVLGSGVKVVGEVSTLDNEPIAPMNKITDLRKAIGVNDKFLLLRDLFAGDVALYERTIDALNRFEDLDECMIFIVENFSWNPDSEGAKMLVELIERKLS